MGQDALLELQPPLSPDHMVEDLFPLDLEVSTAAAEVTVHRESRLHLLHQAPGPSRIDKYQMARPARLGNDPGRAFRQLLFMIAQKRSVNIKK